MPFDKNNRPKALLDLYDKVIFFLFVKFMNRGDTNFSEIPYVTKYVVHLEILRKVKIYI